MLTFALEIVRQQHAMLRACSSLTPHLRQSYEGLIRMTEGDKEVAWADENAPDNDASLMDVSTSTLTQTQQTLFNSFVMRASPMPQRNTVVGNAPVSASPNVIPTSLGILSTSTLNVDPGNQQTPAPISNTPKFTGPSQTFTKHTPLSTPNAPSSGQSTAQSRLPTPKSSIFSLPGSIRQKFSRSRSPAIVHNSSGSNNVATHATPKGIVSSTSRVDGNKAPEQVSPLSVNKRFLQSPRRKGVTTDLPETQTESPRSSRIYTDSSPDKPPAETNYVQLYKMSCAKNTGRALLNSPGRALPSDEGNGAQAHSSIQSLWKRPNPQLRPSPSHFNMSKSSLFRIPNKPRVPTPIDSYSSSSASCVTYSTRLNTMLNSKRMPSAPNLPIGPTSQLHGSVRRLPSAEPYTLPTEITKPDSSKPFTGRNSTTESSCSTSVTIEPPSSTDSYPDSRNHSRASNTPRATALNRLSRSPPSEPHTPTNFYAFEDNFVSPHIQHGVVTNTTKSVNPPPAKTVLCRPQSSLISSSTGAPLPKSPSSRPLSIGLSSISSAFKRIGNSVSRPVSMLHVSSPVYQSIQTPLYASSGNHQQTRHGSLNSRTQNTVKRSAFQAHVPPTQTQNITDNGNRSSSFPAPEDHNLNTTFTVESEVRTSVSRHTSSDSTQHPSVCNEEKNITAVAHEVTGGRGNPLVTLHVNTVSVIQERPGEYFSVRIHMYNYMTDFYMPPHNIVRKSMIYPVSISKYSICNVKHA